jgi:galactose mutarotase-like enzyme
LALNDGLQGYVEHGTTMGVPLLHPWANRLARFTYDAGGTPVALPTDSPLINRDPSGPPIHGALPRLLRWDVVAATSAELTARLEWTPASAAFAVFPFVHRLEYRAHVSGRTLEIAVTLEATGDDTVPVSFGFHPYLRIPGGARAAAELRLPVQRRLVLDDSMIPTGETEPFEPGARSLGDTTWDDGFRDLLTPARFVLEGSDATVSLTFLRGYDFAQVFAPPGSDFVCFEPMTAPTNALVSGGPDLNVVAPGGRYDAAFEITVEPDPGGVPRSPR